MNSLFIVFDPKTLTFIQFNWIRVILTLIIISLGSFWFKERRNRIIYENYYKYVHLEFLSLFQNKRNWGQTQLFVTLIRVICNINIIGLLPYIFTNSCHLPIRFFFSFIIFLGPELYHYIFSIEKILIRIVPLGTPVLLIPFLVIIETVRIFIRPLTLGIRLTANIRAGHLLITLIRGSIRVKRNIVLILLILRVLLLLLLLEIGVALIQGFVFSLLRLIYSLRLNE